MASDPAGSSERQSTVTVLGEATIRTEPDEAIVWITLSALDASPGPALANVAKRSDALTELLDELAIARQDRSTTGVTVSEEFDHTKEGRRSLGHRAIASMSVRLTDTDMIGRLIIRASDELDARIAGPSWRISTGNPAWLEAATQAAARAKAMAAAYAAGVDARLGALIALSEPEHGAMIRPLAAHMRTASAGPDMPIEAGEQEVIAAISATFVLDTG
jgi:uncharacterized protein YggE